MLINPDEVVTGALVNAIAVVARQISKAAAGLRKTDEDLATARWFETFRLTGTPPDRTDLSPGSWDQLAGVLSSDETQAALQELLAARLTDAPETDASRARDAIRMSLSTAGSDTAAFADALADYYDDQISSLVARLEAEEPPLLAQIRSEAFSSRMITVLHAIERHTAALADDRQRRGEGREADGGPGHMAAAADRQHLRFRLPRVVAHFTGRDELLAAIGGLLRTGRIGVITQAISGMGGVGKTQLAAGYVAAHQEEYDITAWVRAEDGGVADLAEMAVALALPVDGRTPPERASDTLVFLSNTEQRWLLVFDNAPGPQALAGLPASGNGRILVTSRHRGGYEDFGAELNVDVFDADTARQYLLARSGRSDGEAAAADEIAAALGYLPLALAHAGAYCASDTGVAFGDYLEMLEGLSAQDLFDTAPELFYEHAVTATWNTSITAAQREAPLARAALDMMAYLAPDGIPRSFLSTLEENSLAGRKRVADALAALHRYSLVTLSGNQVSVHRLLQRVIRDQLTGDEQASATSHALTALKAALPDDPHLPATWPQWQELASHVTALASVEAVADLHAAQLVPELDLMCQYLLRIEAPLALDLATRAVAISTAHLGPDHPDTLTARADLSMSFRDVGRLDEAITMDEQIAADTERVLGPEHPDSISSWASLAYSYWMAGRTDEAISLEEKVVADRERLSGADHPKTITARHNLAASYFSAGRIVEAIAVEERVAADRVRVLGPDHPDTLGIWRNLADSYLSAGRTDEAIHILEPLAGDTERVMGPDHPVTLEAKITLGRAYLDAGRTDEAIASLERTTSDAERILGPEHRTTLVSRSRLARSYLPAGRTGEAVDILEQVCAALQRVTGPEHRITLAARCSLANSYQAAGRTSDAIALHEQVTADTERVLGPDHPQTLTARTGLAASYRSAARFTEAIAILEPLLADSERIRGRDHPETVAVRASLEAARAEQDESR